MKATLLLFSGLHLTALLTEGYEHLSSMLTGVDAYVFIVYYISYYICRLYKAIRGLPHNTLADVFFYVLLVMAFFAFVYHNPPNSGSGWFNIVFQGVLLIFGEVLLHAYGAGISHETKLKPGPKKHKKSSSRPNKPKPTTVSKKSTPTNNKKPHSAT